MEYSLKLQKKVNGTTLFRMLLVTSMLHSNCQHSSALHMGHNFSIPTPHSPVLTNVSDNHNLVEFKDPQLIKYITNPIVLSREDGMFRADSYINLCRFVQRYLYINSQLRGELLELADMLTVSKPHLIRAIADIADIAGKEAGKLEEDYKKFINKEITKRDLEKAISASLVSFYTQINAAVSESVDPLLAYMANKACDNATECYFEVLSETRKVRENAGCLLRFSCPLLINCPLRKLVLQPLLVPLYLLILMQYVKNLSQNFLKPE